MTEPDACASDLAAEVPGQPQLGIVVVNYRSHALIEANLGPLPRQRQALVVVVDNFSDAAELAAVRQVAARYGWLVVALDSNRGFGAAVNAGIAATAERGCRTFLTINPDARITERVMSELLAHSLAEPMALISPQVFTESGSVEFRGAYVDLAAGRPRAITGATELNGSAYRLDAAAVPTSRAAAPGSTLQGWLTGACLVIHSQLLALVGGFDESYFLYWEDIDLSYRCEQAGGSLVVRSDLAVVHDEGGTQGPRRGRAKSNGYYRYNCRNRLRFAAARLPRRQLVRWVLSTPSVSWQILLRGGRRQLIQSPGPLLFTVLGSVEGLALAARALILGPAGTGQLSRRPHVSARARS